MHLGELDRLIVIEQETRTLDSANYTTVTWATYLTVWAKLESALGSELNESNEKVAKQTVSFVVRYESGITEKMRVKMDSKYYYIVSQPEYMDRRVFMRLKCEIRDNES